MGAVGSAVVGRKVLDELRAGSAERQRPGVCVAVRIAGIVEDVAGTDPGGRHHGAVSPGAVHIYTVSRGVPSQARTAEAGYWVTITDHRQATPPRAGQAHARILSILDY